MFYYSFELPIKIYKSDHHFNPYFLVYINGTTRKWIDKQGKVVCEYKLDSGILSKEDIMRCFCFTGVYYENYEDYNLYEMYRLIYETKICVKKVKQYITDGKYPRSCMRGEIPKTYHELFSIIGTEIDWNQDPITLQEGKKDYKVYFYPDSVLLKLDIRNDTIYYGYVR